MSYQKLLKNRFFTAPLVKSGITQEEIAVVLTEIEVYTSEELSQIVANPSIVDLEPDSKEVKVITAILARASNSAPSQPPPPVQSPQNITVTVAQDKKLHEMSAKQLINEAAKSSFVNCDDVLDELRSRLNTDVPYVFNVRTKLIDIEETKRVLNFAIQGGNYKNLMFSQDCVLKTLKDNAEKEYVLPNGKTVVAKLDTVAFVHYVQYSEGVNLTNSQIAVILSKPTENYYWTAWETMDEDDKSYFIESSKKKVNTSIKDYLDRQEEEILKNPTAQTSTVSRNSLKNILNAYFTTIEIENLLFEFNLDKDQFPTDSKDKLVLSIISYFERRDNYSVLVNAVKKARPHAFR